METRYVHNRSEGLTRRRNAGSRYQMERPDEMEAPHPETDGSETPSLFEGFRSLSQRRRIAVQTEAEG